ncbi:MAG: aldo/keto reductase [Pseudomonadota bacterium]
MIERIPFGRTGHDSSRAIFGAAALGAMKQERADRTLELLDIYGVNHIDTAASYGESELRLAPFLRDRRGDFFLATKTGERTYRRARDQFHRSLERLGVDHVDLIQMHNLAQPAQWEMAMGPGGALEALVEARDAGLVSHIGVTGHGTYIAEMHLRSLGKFDFASILCPYNYSMQKSPEYSRDFEALYALCQERGVAIQTIKSIARRRWREDSTDPRYSWYEPIKDEDALRRAVNYVFDRPGLFLNTSSDATLLERVLKLASEPRETPTDEQMQADQLAQGVEPLFIRDYSDDVLL